MLILIRTWTLLAALVFHLIVLTATESYYFLCIILKEEEGKYEGTSKSYKKLKKTKTKMEKKDMKSNEMEEMWTRIYIRKA